MRSLVRLCFIPTSSRVCLSFPSKPNRSLITACSWGVNVNKLFVSLLDSSADSLS